MRQPGHFDALNNLGTLLLRAGHRSAARLTYAEAIRTNPSNPVCYVNLGNTFIETNQPQIARTYFESALRLDTNFAPAHQGMSYALTRLQEHHAAEEHRRLGFANSAIAIVNYRGSDAPITVLLVLSAIDGNVATDAFIDDTTFLTVKLFAEYYDPALPLPPHDVVFNAIGDAECSPRAVAAAFEILQKSKRPILNAPAAIAATGRANNARRLGALPDVIAPQTRVYSRTALESSKAAQTIAVDGFSFPLLLRAPGHHTGEYFERVDEPALLAPILAKLPGDEVLAIEFLDARSIDGSVRKYRVMLIDGGLYPLHLAIGANWKAHYFTSETSESALYQTQEEAFLGDFEAAIGERATRALASISATLGLDYAGVDFALAPDDRLLLFEANATMKIVLPGAHANSDPRQTAAKRALDAARNMLMRRSQD